ncbi:flagellar protein FliT [Haloimpatiens sp. FM7330]
MIEEASNEKIDNIGDLLEKRQEIINSINELNYSKEEFKKVASDLDIVNLENELRGILENKKMECKREIDKVKKKKTAHQVYNSAFTKNSYFIKQKI